MSLGVNHPELVSRGEFEPLLETITSQAKDPNAGLFGPESLSWRMNRESALFLGAGRAALLQLAHPWVTTALLDHSTVLERPIVRFHNTFRIIFTMVFGSLGQAMAAARHLYKLHVRIRGELKEDTAGWKRGTPYEANEINALKWVFATLVESAVMAYECALGPLAAGERKQYYAESKRMAALFGISAAALPEDWEAFLAYNQRMHASDELGVSAEARKYATRLLAGAGSWIHPPHWYRALTVAWLPERLRSEFSFAFGDDEARAAENAARAAKRIYRRLPAAVRFVGPYHEAQARLAGRRCGIATRLSNRFWIGEGRLPFGEGKGDGPLRGERLRQDVKRP
jgi:uncharacterized protein (DUF2236 family)